VFVDWLGLAPSVMEAAEMAHHIYEIKLDDEKDKRTIKIDGKDTGWRLIDIIEGRQGMKMGIYVRGDAHSSYKGEQEYAVAFKGTNPLSLSDLINDVEQYLTSKSADMWDAINASKYFVSQKCGYEITFVGHSKGGAEAAGAAIATNRNAILFNPAVLNVRGYGLSTYDYDVRKMLAFIVNGEALNNFYVYDFTDNYITTPKFLESPKKEVKRYSTQDDTFYSYKFEYSALDRHSMEVMKLALKNAGY